jgi:hypothetical protein
LNTQDEFEPNLFPDPNLTMVIPAFVTFATLPVTQFPKKKFQQLTLLGRMHPPSPKTKSVQVQSHKHGSIQAHQFPETKLLEMTISEGWLHLPLKL